MILKQKNTNIAYRCPSCTAVATGFVGSFSLMSDMLKLKCPCHDSEMTMTYTSGKEKEKKIRLSVPCLFCGKNHNYVVSQNVFFNSELFLLNCPYTNMDIAFVGTNDKISEEIKRSDKELKLLFDEAGIESPEELKTRTKKDGADDNLPDAEVYDIVRYLVSELKEDGAIDCPCHSGSYDFEFTGEGIRVFCPECGADYIFCATSVASAEEFLSCDRLELKNH
ncbi:MAG: hypothetical protein SOZ62_00700 [Eubacteriales bacterium]|nr:hypothetical protein [Eubacteriales bacterium]